MKCNIRGLNLYFGEAQAKFTLLATAEIEWPDLQLVVRGARLTHSEEMGYMAHGPTSARGGAAPIFWKHNSDMAKSACDAMLAMYVKMGGRSPEAVVNESAAKRRIAERKAAEPKPKPQPVPVRTIEQIDADMPLAEMGLSRPEAAGLARTLGIPV